MLFKDILHSVHTLFDGLFISRRNCGLEHFFLSFFSTKWSYTGKPRLRFLVFSSLPSLLPTRAVRTVSYLGHLRHTFSTFYHRHPAYRPNACLHLSNLNNRVIDFQPPRSSSSVYLNTLSLFDSLVLPCHSSTRSWGPYADYITEIPWYVIRHILPPIHPNSVNFPHEELK